MYKKYNNYLEIGLIILVYLILGVNTYFVVSLGNSSINYQIGLNLIAGLIILLFYRKKLGEKVGLNKGYSLSKIKVITVISIGSILPIALILGLFKYMNIIKVHNINDGRYSSYGMIIGFIVGLIVQEIFFRGILFNKLREKLNIKVALVVQALLFAVVFINIGMVLSMFMLGLIFGIIYIYSDSLWGAITGHMILGIMIIIQKVLLDKSSSFPRLCNAGKMIFMLVFIIFFIWAIKIFVKKFIEKDSEEQLKKKIEKKARKKENRKFKLTIIGIVLGVFILGWIIVKITNFYACVKEAENNPTIMKIVENKNLGFNEKLAQMNKVCEEENLDNNLSRELASVAPKNIKTGDIVINNGIINGQPISKEGINKDIFNDTEYKGISNEIVYENSGNLEKTLQENADIMIRYYNPNILTKKTLLEYFNNVVAKGIKGNQYILEDVYDNTYVIRLNVGNNIFMTGNMDKNNMMLGNNNLMENTIEKDGKIETMSWNQCSKEMFILTN